MHGVLIVNVNFKTAQPKTNLIKFSNLAISMENLRVPSAFFGRHGVFVHRPTA